MSKPVRARAQKPDDASLQIVRRISSYAEQQTLSRVRDYLGRGRPLAGLPAQSLEAQWIAAYLEFHGLDDDSREDELRDLGTEFDLRGLAPPWALVTPELARFNERFGKALRRRARDPAVVARAEAELEAISDRLIEAQRWS
jgi:hypothetical protein